MIENDIINEEYCRILQSKHFDSEEERDRFINSLNDDFHTIPVADPLSNAGRALQMVEAANWLEESEGTVLVKQALEIDPSCIEVYRYLGDCEVSDSKSLQYFIKGITLGRRLFSRDYIKENRGLFCSIPETRSFMGCLCGYGNVMELCDIDEEAIRVYETMISLDIKDHSSIRFPLMLLMIKTNNFKKFARYEQRFHEESSIHYLYNRALCYFKKTGDSKIANDFLDHALSKNRTVASTLISISPIKRLPPVEDTVSMWATMYSFVAKRYWIRTDGAIKWLRKKLNTLN